MGTPNGAFQLESMGEVRFQDISDGTSKTIAIGEKHVPWNMFGQGWLDSSLYNGDYGYSSFRSAGYGYGLAVSPWQYDWLYGSYHPGVCQFIFCDNHLVSLKIETPQDVLDRLANRSDGQATPDY